MTTDQIRSKFLDFMKSKGHSIIPSAPVFLKDDPTVLFTTAGMQPLVPYLLGAPHPEGKRLADAQKCIRTTDIEEVGDPWHFTMIEMLGNWSLGDYFKKDSIAWSFEFLTDKKWLNLDPKRLYITVYEGDHQVTKDTESIELWQGEFGKVGIDAQEGQRILCLGKDDNWWEIGGAETSPAGPDTEVFYYVGDKENPKFDVDSDDFPEIWNNVFMTYQRTADGSYNDLPAKNVDTGMGLERIATVIQGFDTAYKTDVISKILHSVFEYANKSFEPVYHETDHEIGRAGRIITDHLRSAVFMAGDGVVPSNTERGYVMRRLIRRAVRQGLVLGIRQDLSENIAPVIIDLYQQAYPELEHNRKQILDVLDREESQFRQTLDRGVREFTKIVKDKLTGQTVFTLFDTYGFPPELSVEDAKRLNIAVDSNWEKDFQKLMDEQKERSRTATAGEFKGGLADHEPDTIRHHTATHLMYEALRRVLGDGVIQRGSNVNSDRLRFDFSFDRKLTDEEKHEIEKIVNEQIEADLPVSWEEMPTDEAFEHGAKGAFGDKYGETVKVYTIGKPGEKAFSIEICGGPHVEHTGTIGKFRIQKEESSSAGVRRIKATVK
ncbi:MAG TPA: alanine--tRNA ligase [Candidatus Saccharimonadales bacterium]|nr:alanine--tRNA ligase [Candidatus Saccharimonadales bacterium]